MTYVYVLESWIKSIRTTYLDDDFFLVPSIFLSLGFLCGKFVIEPSEVLVAFQLWKIDQKFDVF